MKSPKSVSVVLKILAASGCFDADWVGSTFGADFGPVSKKPPPLSGGDVTCGGAGSERFG